MTKFLNLMLMGSMAWANGAEPGEYETYIGGLWLLIFLLAGVALFSLFFRGRFFGAKKCPYCAERIAKEAIKCRYCGETMEKQIG